MYVLASVPPDGMIRVQGNVAHKESVGMDRWGATCYSTLAAAKDAWEGPEGEQIILALGEDGSGTVLWMGKPQVETLVTRLARWKGCYGGWKVLALNA